MNAPYYPIFVNLNGKSVLIVGGGFVATQKVMPMLESGARVTVVSPDLSERLKALHQDGQFEWIERKFTDGDLINRFLVIAATNDSWTNQWIFDACETRQIPVNVVDVIDNCNFIVPSIARSGPVQVAISTSGTSPTLAKQLRVKIQEDLLTPETGLLAEFFGSWRDRVKARFDTYEEKKGFWEKVFESNVPELVKERRWLDAKASMEDLLGEDLPPSNPNPPKTKTRTKPLLSQPKPASAGKVWLVGAGPGAVDLLTVRAARVLGQADVVLYDRLANPKMLNFTPKTAERIYVGKDLGADAEARQHRIHALMIGHALEGKTVVRLKGGDPFVFGRGGEELVQLRQAGIEAEIVPGISSCISAPSAANIPVTYRGVTPSFGVFAAQPGQSNPSNAVDWEAASRIGTAVFLMGVSKLATIVDQLIKHGRSADTPVAVIEKATRPDQRVITGTLTDILDKAIGVKPPATIVVGEVVDIRALTQTLEQQQEQPARFEVLTA